MGGVLQGGLLQGKAYGFSPDHFVNSVDNFSSLALGYLVLKLGKGVFGDKGKRKAEHQEEDRTPKLGCPRERGGNMFPEADSRLETVLPLLDRRQQATATWVVNFEIGRCFVTRKLS